MKLTYTMSELRRELETTEYQILRWIDQGLLEKPLPRNNDSETRRWTRGQVDRLKLNLEELANPQPAKKSILSKRNVERLRAAI